ncbi:MAG TPA: hypothetical protein VF407_07795 [Polyangiaceae bacterium]
MPPLRTVLATPHLPRLVPDGVFDAFEWTTSKTLEWWRPHDRWDCSIVDQAENPSGMTFVLREGRGEFLPRELACMHATGCGFENEQALAPYGIDDATDLLYERQSPPNETMWLVADGLRALFWGLHDWAHFHNHGPFEERAWTELQCDASALVWLAIAKGVVPSLHEETWDELRASAVAISRKRFEDEGKSFDEDLLSADWLRRWAREASL